MPTFTLCWDTRPLSPGFAPSRWFWFVSADCPGLPTVGRSGIAATADDALGCMRAHRVELLDELERAGFEVRGEVPAV